MSDFPHVDFNGHFKNGTDIEWMKKEWERTDRGDLLTDIRDGDGGLSRTSASLFKMLIIGSRGCPFCHVDVEVTQEEGGGWKVTEPCTDPEGTSATVEFNLNIPSGKMVVANDLRAWFPGEPSFDSDKTIGKRDATLWASKRGFAFGFVGNSCPGVYRTQKGYLIANPPQTEMWDGGREKFVRVKTTPFRHRRIAGVCTDLWWYSICDYDELQLRAKMLGVKAPTGKDVYVVPVRPGLYHFKHDNQRGHEYESPEPTIYAEITKVGPALPWKPEDSEVHAFLKESITASRMLQQSIRNWPTLYTQKFLYDEKGNFTGRGPTLTWNEMNAEQRRWSLQRVADHFLCVLGGGVDWHPNGHPIGQPVDDDIQEVEIPEFDFQAHWYPFSTNKQDCPMISVNLAPTWAKLAFNIVQSILTYGVAPSTSSDHYPPSYYKKKASQVYRVLREKYPEHVNPEFDAKFLAGN